MGAVIGEDAINAAADFNDQLAALRSGIRGLVARLAGSFLPVIQKVATAFQEWLADPKTQKGIRAFTRNISMIARRIGPVIDAFLEAGAGSGEFSRGFSPILPQEKTQQ